MIEAVMRTIALSATNAKKPSTTDAAIARTPATTTRAFAIGFPAGKPLPVDDCLTSIP
jgi:hypothetical protein